MKTHVVGVWAGKGSELLREIRDGMPIMRLTMRRIAQAGAGADALVPWMIELDHLAGEIHSWGMRVSRTHPDQRIAMRDLVAKMGAEIGILVQGEAAAIDADEIRFARARLENGWDEYISKRITAYPSARWLQVQDSTEWIDVMGLEEARRLYRLESMEASARYLAARRGPLQAD